MIQQSVFLYNLKFGLYDFYTEGISIQVYGLSKSTYAIVTNDDVRIYNTPGKFWLVMSGLLRKYGEFEYTKTKMTPEELEDNYYN